MGELKMKYVIISRQSNGNVWYMKDRHTLVSGKNGAKVYSSKKWAENMLAKLNAESKQVFELLEINK
jgi:hypothetical protein